ncbi:MAG: PCMD domain-containing protein, partial [Fimbriimonadaceae bacterium]
MKKQLLIALLAISSAAFAQIPNNGFEDWSNPSGASYQNPTGWGSSNEVGAQLSPPFVNVTKETADPASGLASIKLETINLFVTNVAGVALTGEITYQTTLKFSGGFPYTSRPGSLTGKIKYLPAAATDSSFIYAVLFKWNSAQNKRDTIAIATLKTGAVNSWTSFGAVLNYSLPDNPDSALILISSSKGFLGSAGSRLWVDDLAFQYSAGTEDIHNNITVFPNPAQHMLYLNAIPGQYRQAAIFNYTGMLIMNHTVQGNAVDISALPNGT